MSQGTEASSVQTASPAGPQVEGGFPAPLTPLIGRHRELDHIGRVLRARATRLLVLTGPGGVGKSRLALAAASNLAGEFADGVAFVALGLVSADEEVLPAIAAAVGLRGEGAGALTLDAVGAALQDREMLLVLDNFEHLLSTASLLAELLRASPGLTILVTSRSVLGVYGENVYPVPPFDVPDDEDIHPDAIGDLDAVQLFVSRVQAVRPSFSLNERSAKTILTICRRLDGIPFAIELAAARTSLFSVSELASRLEQRLPLLESGLRDIPDRYRTMRNAIMWSYDLLSPFEQKVFRHLAVFTGAWTLEGASAVVFGKARLDDQHEVLLLSAIGSLVDKSLVQRVEVSDHERNFQLLQVLREFAQEELDAHGERDLVEQRYADYIVEYARRASPHLTGRDQVLWLDQLSLMEADIATVFERLMDAGSPQAALELIASVWRYGYARGNIVAWRSRLERALQQAPERNRIRAKALNAAGVLSNMLGEPEETRRFHAEALEIARELGEKHLMGMALFGLGDVAVLNGDDDEAERSYLEAERLYTEADQTRGIAISQTNLGNLYWKQGRLQDALKIHEAARRLYEAAEDQRGLAWAYTNVGRLSAELKEYNHAAVNLSRAMSLYDLLGDRNGIAETLEGYVLINLGVREFARAARLLGAAQELRDVINHPVPMSERPSYDQMVETLRRSLDGAMDDLVSEGAVMPLDDAISLAVTTSVTSEAAPRVTTGDVETRDMLERLGITDRELQVLQKLGAGETDKEIAESLYISVRTVQTHVQNLLSKFGVTSRSAAVAKAFRIGLLR